MGFHPGAHGVGRRSEPCSGSHDKNLSGYLNFVSLIWSIDFFVNGQLFIFIVFFLFEIQSMAQQSLNGVYSLTGVREMAAAFKFDGKGRFEFFYSYGAVDRHATGSYVVEGDSLKLKSDKQPGADFLVTAQSRKGTSYSLHVSDPNPYLLQHIACIAFKGQERMDAMTDDRGEIHFDEPALDRIYLQHQLFPDIVSLIKDEQNSNNHFELKLLPSLAEVSFKGIDFGIKDDELSCLPNYFMPFENIRFVKED